ncbi:hypothetical protein TNCV_4574241 [Trichonephila clavipes]|uniref:Uncharacterized protein n=2 Tax=Trichonephila TaxID=2585208 RepID=A0A8X6M7C6_TRICU|nr:hypothetical protein TNCT_181341 [Trichonephila clavata]GFV95422.1 hypothetical protein TNCV_4574241 [Trichonephila clavipes]GFY41520.1 hypothetical protein TNIN_212891 [Trichonephila inaurata madagascariensis]
MPIAFALSKVNRSRFFTRLEAGGPVSKSPDLSSSLGTSFKRDKCLCPEHTSGGGRNPAAINTNVDAPVIYCVSVTVVTVPVKVVDCWTL